MKIPDKKSAYAIENLEEARERILELEEGLDDAIAVILKRDAQLQTYERQIVALGGKLPDDAS